MHGELCRGKPETAIALRRHPNAQPTRSVCQVFLNLPSTATRELGSGVVQDRRRLERCLDALLLCFLLVLAVNAERHHFEEKRDGLQRLA